MSNLLLALKLLNTMLQLAEIFDAANIWRNLERMLLEVHPKRTSQRPIPDEGDATASFATRSLLHAIICCYKGYLVASIRTSERQKKERQDLQHLLRISCPANAPTKSYQASVQINEQASQQAKSRSSSDMIALLLARVLARLLQPEGLQRAAWIVMLHHNLPRGILDSIAEAGCFDHCEVGCYLLKCTGISMV